MTNEFAPTHRIICRRHGGEVSRTDVVLEGDSGPAYTADEWASSSAADWECDDDGEWTFQGEACPSGVDEVEVFDAYHPHPGGAVEVSLDNAQSTTLISAEDAAEDFVRRYGESNVVTAFRDADDWRDRDSYLDLLRDYARLIHPGLPTLP